MTPIHLVVRDLTSMARTESTAARNVLTAADYQQLSSRAEVRDRQLLMRGLRRRLLAEQLDCDPAALVFAQTADGKPWLPQQRLRFNLSHSRNMLALAWSQDDIELGVDIEDRDRRLRMQELAAHCFSPEEISIWETQGSSKDQWLLIWTRKEALLKCAGIGLRMALPKVDTAQMDKQGNVTQGQLAPMTVKSWQLPGQILSLAWNKTAANATHIVLDAAGAHAQPAQLTSAA